MDTAQGTLIVLTITLVVLSVYTWMTRRQAKAAEDTARESRRMAEASIEASEASSRSADTALLMALDHRSATLAPYLEQYIEITPQTQGAATTVRVYYRNAGSGPAIRIAWQVENSENQRLPEIRWRNSMATTSPEGWVEFQIGQDDFRRGLKVLAEYESVFGIIWRSALPLISEPSEQATVNGVEREQSYQLLNEARGIVIEQLKNRTIQTG
jgi:hypothetical protein